MSKKDIGKLVGFSETRHIKEFEEDLKKLLTRYGLALLPDRTIHCDRGIVTTELEIVTTYDKMFDAFCRKSAERTRIYADSLHEPYAKKPWFKHCCKCCKNRVNYPVAGAICSMVSCAETNCQLVKKWIETRIK